jgi:hypothetical protein
MTNDVFGNLTEWGKVLGTLERIRTERLLDEHQPGLARLVRYPDNWRLREAALGAALEVSQANDLLVADVLHAVVDPSLGFETRVLAARALGHLLPLRPPQVSTGLDPERIQTTLQDLLDRTYEPVLRRALTETLDAARTRRTH